MFRKIVTPLLGLNARRGVSLAAHSGPPPGTCDDISEAAIAVHLPRPYRADSMPRQGDPLAHARQPVRLLVLEGLCHLR
jgi:hypothetical protein